MTHTIISKRTAPFTYTKWVKINGQFHQDGPGILINGGSGVVGGAELLSNRPLERRNTLIPISVLTFVDDKALDKLMSIPKFRSDIARGLIVVVRGKKLDQDKGDAIAQSDMLEDENNPARPITKEEIENAGASFNKDGSIDIGEVDGMSPLKVRMQEAGKMSYEKKRLRKERKDPS